MRRAQPGPSPTAGGPRQLGRREAGRPQGAGGTGSTRRPRAGRRATWNSPWWVGVGDGGDEGQDPNCHTAPASGASPWGGGGVEVAPAARPCAGDPGRSRRGARGGSGRDGRSEPAEGDACGGEMGGGEMGDVDGRRPVGAARRKPPQQGRRPDAACRRQGRGAGDRTPRAADHPAAPAQEAAGPGPPAGPDPPRPQPAPPRPRPGPCPRPGGDHRPVAARLKVWSRIARGSGAG